MKHCVICNSTRFSIRINELSLPENERYYPYGDCCCMTCSVEKYEQNTNDNPDKYKMIDIIINDVTYSFKQIK